MSQKADVIEQLNNAAGRDETGGIMVRVLKEPAGTPPFYATVRAFADFLESKIPDPDERQSIMMTLINRLKDHETFEDWLVAEGRAIGPSLTHLDQLFDSWSKSNAEADIQQCDPKAPKAS